MVFTHSIRITLAFCMILSCDIISMDDTLIFNAIKIFDQDKKSVDNLVDELVAIINVKGREFSPFVLQDILKLIETKDLGCLSCLRPSEKPKPKREIFSLLIHVFGKIDSPNESKKCARITREFKKN